MNKSIAVYWSSGASLEREENKDEWHGGEEEKREGSTSNSRNTIDKISWFCFYNNINQRIKRLAGCEELKTVK